MSSLTSSNFQVKVNQLSEAETEEGELGVCIDIEPALDATKIGVSSAAIDTAAVTSTNVEVLELEVDADIGDDNASGSNDTASSEASFFFSGIKASIATTVLSFLLNKKTAAVFTAAILLGTGAIAGIYVNEYNHKNSNNKRQKEALAAITGHGRSHSSNSKSGMSSTSAVCLSDHDPIKDGEQDGCEPKVVECGDIFTNEEIALTHDLYCENNYWDATDEEKDEHRLRIDAAITLSGPDASIDCRGNSIRQIRTEPSWPPPMWGEPRECNHSSLGSHTSSDDPFWFYRQNICGMSYHAGILLRDGAKAINCKAEEFYERICSDGFLIINGGEVKSSEASLNAYGVAILDVNGTRESVVSDVYTHDSFYGIEVRNSASSNAVMIEKVTSKLNDGGMHLFGPDITVKDSTISYNTRYGGITVGSNDLYFFEPEGDYTTKVFFEGKVSSHNNSWHGLWFLSFGGRFDDSPLYAEFTVKGDISLYLNGGDGLSISSTPHHDILFTVEESGSLNSCHNEEIDIRNSAIEVSFIDESTDADGFRCESTLEQHGGQGLPVCAPCPDVCN